jgi:ParB family chromosome partitioning protein
MTQECPGREPESEIHKIEVEKIDISDANVRKHAAERDLEELAESIRKHGQFQPIILRGSIQDPRHEVIIGQRRFLAVRDILHHKHIKATFAGEITDTEASIRSLTENLVRSDLSYEDTANAVTALYKHFKKDDRRVSKETGLSLRKVRQFIDIEERASEKTKEKLRKKLVQPIDVQRALRAASGNIAKADELLELMKKYSLSTFQKSRMVDYGLANPRASAEEIIKRAQPPAVERTFIVRLPEKARVGLLAASKQLKMGLDEVASVAVEEWLAVKGFL